MAGWWRTTAALFLLLIEVSIGQGNDVDLLLKRFERMETELEQFKERVRELEVKDKEQTEMIRRLEERVLTCEIQSFGTRNMENLNTIKIPNESVEELRVRGNQIIPNSNGTGRHDGLWKASSNNRLSLNRDFKSLLDLISPNVSVKQRQGIQVGNPSIKETRPVSRVGRQYDSVNEQVAFSATITPHDYGPLGANQIMVFDHVLTNIGNGYHAHSGIFIAPVDGVYVISVTISGWKHAIDHSYLQMKQNGSFLCYIWAASGHQSSQTLVLRLKKNDEIYLSNNEASDIILGGSYSSFSGFLLYVTEAVNAVVGK